MPTAKVGAPPARDRIEVSPTSLASWVSVSRRDGEAPAEMPGAALSAVVPISAGGLFMAK